MTPERAARALVAGGGVGTLATVAADGGPWASLVAYALLPDGSPVLCVSDLAEHGRNLVGDPRASLCVAGGPAGGGDVLDRPRVTLAGRVARPDGAGARAAFVAQVPGAEVYAGFADFTTWILGIERIRWVGGLGRMATVDVAAYAAA